MKAAPRSLVLLCSLLVAATALGACGSSSKSSSTGVFVHVVSGRGDDYHHRVIRHLVDAGHGRGRQVQ